MTKQTILSTLAIAMMCGATRAQQNSIRVEKSVEHNGQAQKLLQVLQNQPGGAKLEKSTYLGIASSSVSAALREQLKLKQGIGLVVERVEKESPAEQAGVKQYDIVEKMDDQLLVNAGQFAALVRMKEPGTKVTLAVIRQGQPQTITATLAQKELPATFLLEDGTVDPFGKALISTSNWKAFNLNGPLDWNARTTNNMTITSVVGQNAITITRDGDNTHLVAKDLNGNQLFDGDVNNEEQWAQVPPDIAAEARRLVASMKLNINIPKAATIDQLIRQRKVPANPQEVEPALPAKPVQPALP